MGVLGAFAMSGVIFRSRTNAWTDVGQQLKTWGARILTKQFYQVPGEKNPATPTLPNTASAVARAPCHRPLSPQHSCFLRPTKAIIGLDIATKGALPFSRRN
jgi:hypothetical protein